ncbi:MAG: response regulator [Proteobacteria bacterium]|nr:response regulator [Pseudomonadota bacterium]
MAKHVLVIDDEEAIRKSFVLALEDTGHQVDTAGDGRAGIAKVEQRRYDLIFLDLKMPGLNGVETLRAIRKIENKAPVYIVTAFHSEYFDQLKEAEAEGCEFQLVKKPIGIDQIGYLVESVLGG